MTVSQAPLSVRNNNPGNLRFVGQEGASPGEGGFARFESPEAGLAAMRNQIELDTQTRGLTLTQFINKYAPPSENKTGNYIDFVVKRTGLDPAGRVPVERIADLQTAMIEMEGGPRALDVFKLQPAKPTAVAKAPEIRMAETRTTQPVAFRGQNLPQSYTTALALNYIADTDPDSKIMEQVNQMMQEMQGGGGNARQIAAALKPLTAEEPEVDPFAIMAQAQQAQAQEDAQRRRVVPRMPVRMANGGSMDKSLLELAAMGQKPYYTAEEKAWIAAREKEYEDYNRQVEDYNRKLEQYKKDAEEYNKAVAPYLSEVEAYNQALKRYQEEVYAPYESEVQSYNKALEDYKANVYNPYLSEIEKYNQALEEYEQNVYNPYVKRVEEYNKALEEYNQQNYPGYDKAVADYNKAAEDYNARLKAYEEYTAKAPEYYIGATAENPVPYVISWNPKYDGYFRAYQGFDPLNPGQLSGSPVQYWADWARGGAPGWSRIPTDYEFVQTATVPVYGEKGNFAAGYFRKTGAPAYGSVTSPGEFTLTAPTAPTPYPVAAPTAPDPFGQAEPTKPEDFNRVAPVQPSPFSMTQPTAPSVTSPLQPTQPGTPQYTQEQFEEYVTGAQGRAKKAAAQRASALSIAANPEQYGLSGFGLSLPFEAGGEVNKADLEAKGEVTITPQQREEYFRNLDQALMRMQMSAGDLSGQLVRTPTGIDVRATTNVAGVRPFVDIDPGRLTVSRYGASYGQMSPQGGYDITVQQQASVPTPVGPVNLPPSLRGTYVRPIGKDATVMVEGTYSPGPQPFYQVGGRYVKRFEKGGAVEQNPADIAEQMTVGTIPEGKSGVLGNVARDVVRGAQYLPYDILGAPVDIATMAMRPFGYNVEKPVGGSEYLIEKARQAGIAQAPTGSMAETATRIGMGFVNPAAVARQIPKGIATLEKGVEKMTLPAFRQITGNPNATKEEMMDFVLNQKNIMQAGAPAIVKPKGGTFVSGEHSTFDNALEDITSSINREKQNWGYAADAGDMVKKLDTISDFFNTRFKNYYQKRLGSQDDPLRDAFVRGDFNGGDWFNVQELNDIRARIANPQTSSAQKEELLRLLNSKYDAWTDINAIVPERNSIGKKLAYPSSESVNIIQKKLKEQGVSVDKKDISVTAETRDNYLIGDKGLKAINQGDVAYDVGSSPTLSERADLIKDYLMTLNPNQIKNITFEDAIIGAERYHEALKNPAIKFTPQELFEGREKMFNVGDKYQWSEIKTVEALKREGLAMDHCIQGDDYCRQLISGVGRHFSLQDAKTGIPHTTISTYRSPFAGPEAKHVVIGQIKGHSNSIASKYFDQIEKFLEEYEKQVGKIYITEKPKFIPPAFKKAEYTQLPRGYEGNQYAKGGMVDKPLYDRAA